MKNLLTHIFAFMMIGFTVNTKAQSLATVNASAAATIVVPMRLTTQNILNFGSTEKKSGTSGSVVLSAGDASRDFDGGVSGSSIGDAASNPVFNVSGARDSSYSITLPTTITVVETGSMKMIINDLKLRFNGAADDIAILEGNNSISKVLNGEGTDSFKLGGKLNIDSDQAEGLYYGSFIVTVDYN